ncbi:HEAT repeat domain-containing protein [Nannocystis sp. SCPEA4]|uniref:variant leucine-rich repeat-containing protein n=1 Tax=Nannocystis sp. SCPEA4 TaxID=2996787 RepID=UPI00226F7941|nr:HEAT repeat domain-containing protein [Nannocystis sp. SCPEA4]MCY1061384.1 HEAT repeat domain-containing protein [Nannocystis sp. SCPEA4]
MGKVDYENLLGRAQALASSPAVDQALVADIVRLLTAGSPQLRKRLAELVHDLERKATAAALTTADDEPAGPRRADILALARRGPTARAELPTLLLKILDGDDEELRSLAAEALGAVSPGNAELLPRLLTILFQQPRLDLRAMRYARAVASVGPAAAPELFSKLETGDSLQRALAVTALCVLFVDSPQPAALPLLLRAVEDKELGDARAHAVAALGALAGISQIVLPTLAELLRDRDVRVSREAAVALARNGANGAALLRQACAKKTRPPALKKLGWVLDDPPHALPLLLLLLGDEGPDLADDATRTRIRQCIGQRRSAPALLLHRLVRDKDSETRLSMALNQAAPPEIFAILAKDRNDEVRRLVADNRATPAVVLATLAADKNDDVKRTVAENPNTPAEALEQLLKAKISRIRRLVARHKHTPLERLEAFVTHSEPLVRCAVAGNPNLPYPLLEQLRQDNMLELSEAVAMHPHAPLHVLEGLARHRERRIRAAAALNPKLPTTLLCELAQDSSPEVRRSLAENPSTPPAVLRALASAALYKVDEALIDNPRTPPDALALLASREEASTRRDVLAHDNLPDDLIARLATDADARVRATALLRMDPRRPSWVEVEPSWAEFGDTGE